MTKTTTNSEAETIAYANTFAETLSGREIILLSGNLGAGKTVFTKALIRNLCDAKDLEVPSPTFTLVQTYNSPKGPIYHFDLYRLEDPEEIYELGWEDAMHEGLCIVEWPERLGGLKPKTCTEITISHVPESPERRIIEIHKR